MSQVAAQKAIFEQLEKQSQAGASPALSRRVFDKYDKDSSDSLDVVEFKAMVYDLGHYLTNAEADLAFRTIDLDGNGGISYAEFYRFWREDNRFTKLRKSEDELKRLQAAVTYFQYFDKDRSGQLDKQEFAGLHADLVKNGMTTQDLDSCFSELDTDGSGTISFNEYVEWISYTRAPRQQVLPGAGSK